VDFRQKPGWGHRDRLTTETTATVDGRTRLPRDREGRDRGGRRGTHRQGARAERGGRADAATGAELDRGAGNQTRQKLVARFCFRGVVDYLGSGRFKIARADSLGHPQAGRRPDYPEQMTRHGAVWGLLRAPVGRREQHREERRLKLFISLRGGRARMAISRGRATCRKPPACSPRFEQDFELGAVTEHIINGNVDRTFARSASEGKLERAGQQGTSSCSPGHLLGRGPRARRGGVSVSTRREWQPESCRAGSSSRDRAWTWEAPTGRRATTPIFFLFFHRGAGQESDGTTTTRGGFYKEYIAALAGRPAAKPDRRLIVRETSSPSYKRSRSTRGAKLRSPKVPVPRGLRFRVRWFNEGNGSRGPRSSPCRFFFFGVS